MKRMLLLGPVFSLALITDVYFLKATPGDGLKPTSHI
jgi:hypothetical protein